MITLRLLLSFSDRRLGLVEGDDRTVVFVASPDTPGEGFEVHLPTLRARLDQLGPEIDRLVFVGEPFPDPFVLHRIDDLLAAQGDFDALAVHRPVTEAIKEVADGFLHKGIDRSTLTHLDPPIVTTRRVLEGALASLGDKMWVDPIEVLVAAGARVGVHPPQGPADRRAGAGAARQPTKQ